MRLEFGTSQSWLILGIAFALGINAAVFARKAGWLK